MRLKSPYILVRENLTADVTDGILNLITEEDWLYDSIMLRHSTEWKTETIRNMPLYDKYELSMRPILEIIGQHYKINDYASLIAKLKPNGVAAKHVDSGEFLEPIHRLHIPLQTNPECMYQIEGGDVNMKVGSMYEIGNQRRHGVINSGASDRIHLIVNVYGHPI